MFLQRFSNNRLRSRGVKEHQAAFTIKTVRLLGTHAKALLFHEGDSTLLHYIQCI